MNEYFILQAATVALVCMNLSDDFGAAILPSFHKCDVFPPCSSPGWKLSQAELEY